MAGAQALMERSEVRRLWYQEVIKPLGAPLREMGNQTVQLVRAIVVALHTHSTPASTSTVALQIAADKVWPKRFHFESARKYLL